MEEKKGRIPKKEKKIKEKKPKLQPERIKKDRPDRKQIIHSVIVAAILVVMAAVIFFAAFLRLSHAQDLFIAENGAGTGTVQPQSGTAPKEAAKPLKTSFLVLLCIAAALLITGMFAIYIFNDNKKLVKNPKMLLITASLIILSTALTAVTTLAAYTFTTALVAVILIGILVDKKTAFASTLVVSAITGLMAFNTVGPQQLNAMSVSIATLTGGLCSVFALNLKHNRIVPIFSGLIGGGASTLAYMCVQAFCRVSFSDMIIDSLWLFGCSVLNGIIATGLMPVFEALFDIVTDARLNELMSNSTPLLKRLMTEAPGTYYHSLLVANLAESAAAKVGANPLLCKAAGYYHDVGKLRSPMHFKENQRDYNIHDDLPPEESAARIIAHQADGVTLLTKYKLPSDIIKIAAEHHGDSLVYFFYNKAVQQSGSAEAVDINKFRYHAPRPSSKESAIVMLADCCEASVRSIPHPTPELIADKIHEIIGNIFYRPGSVLSEAPITAKDISLIEKDFVKTLSAQYHERIEYPDLEKIENGYKA